MKKQRFEATDWISAGLVTPEKHTAANQGCVEAGLLVFRDLGVNLGRIPSNWGYYLVCLRHSYLLSSVCRQGLGSNRAIMQTKLLAPLRRSEKFF